MLNLVHGGDIYSTKPKIDLSANINPLGMPQSVIDAVKMSLNQCHNYPDPLCRELTLALSVSEGINKDWIICGNGAADIIFRLVYAVKPTKALILAPTFAEYEQALIAERCSLVYHKLKYEDKFMVTENLLEDINENIDMLFICNPNNPTGQIVPKDLMVKILNKCREKGVLLIVDECFNDFLEEPEENTMRDYIESYDNLFILKAFTKMYAMAGLRLGYGMCSNKKIRDGIFQCGQPWSVSIPAQAAGIQALKESDYPEKTRAFIRKEKEYLTRELNRLHIEVIGSKANYIFFKADGMKNLKDDLQKRGILIRSCSNYHELTGDYYRIAIKTYEESTIFIRELEEIIQCQV